MKTILFLLLGASLMGQPLFVSKGAVPVGLVRKGPVPMTGSMKPFIRGGEFIYVQSYYLGLPLQIGDILELKTPSGPRLHRVTAMNKRAVYTSGDACRQSDGWTLNKDIISVVRAIERQEPSHLVQVR